MKNIMLKKLLIILLIILIIFLIYKIYNRLFNLEEFDSNSIKSPVKFGPITDTSVTNINLPLNTPITNLAINYTGSDQGFGNSPYITLIANCVQIDG